METNHSIQDAIDVSIRFLESNPEFYIESCENGRRKWNGAWWHMATLYEMGEVKQIPSSAIVRAKYLLEVQTWPTFVIYPDDFPTSVCDKMKMDCCHCELAIYYMILTSYGCDLDQEIPWIREWFLKHQLSDGGLNCEPTAYTHSHKSSIVSTLPPLEAILRHTNRPFTKRESVFLDEGARYLIEHSLVCSKESGHIIDEEWLNPCFPRFFEYDILRGMSYLVEWSQRRNKPLPAYLLNEGLQRLNSHIEVAGLRIGRQVFDPLGPWGGHTFPLLNKVSNIDEVSPYLTKQLEIIIKHLEHSINEVN